MIEKEFRDLISSLEVVNLDKKEYNTYCDIIKDNILDKEELEKIANLLKDLFK